LGLHETFIYQDLLVQATEMTMARERLHQYLAWF